MLLPLLIQNWDPYVPPPGSTEIETLPVVKATIGVHPDEDFILSFAAFDIDGLTPLLLAGISFTATIISIPYGARKAVLSTDSGNIEISGLLRNILTITDFASQKPWPKGAYEMRLLASDGIFTKEVFASSVLTIGAPTPLKIIPVYSRVKRGVLTPI